MRYNTKTIKGRVFLEATPLFAVYPQCPGEYVTFVTWRCGIPKGAILREMGAGRMPLDKREGSVKGTLFLSGAHHTAQEIFVLDNAFALIDGATSVLAERRIAGPAPKNIRMRNAGTRSAS
jgi:hypothetical protein